MANLNIAIKIAAHDQASGPLGSIRGALSGLGNTAGGAAARGFAGLQTAVLGVATLAAGAAVAGVAALGGGLIYAVGQAAAFEQALANTGAVLLATDSEMAQLAETAKHLGATTKFTATEAAEGMTFLAMAGFSVNEVIAAMPGVLNLAAAGNMNLAQTADIASNILQAFNLETAESGRVADVMAAALTTANTDIAMLGEAMKFAAPAAASMGYSIEETTAAIAKLSDAGIQSTMAGTAVRQMLISLAAPTDRAAELMAELGIEIANADGTMKDLPSLIGILNEAFSDLSDVQRTAAISTMFGARNLSAVNVLLNVGEESLREYTEMLEDSGGTAERVATRQLDTFKGAVLLLTSAVDGVAISIGSAFLPILKEVALAGIPLVEGAMARLQPYLDMIPGMIAVLATVVGNFYDNVQGGVPILDAFIRAITGIAPPGVLAFFTRLRDESLPALFNLFQQIVLPIWDMVTQFVRWEDVLAAVGVVVASIVLPALYSIAAAVAPVIAAGVALVAAIALVRTAWEQNWGGIQDKVRAVIDFIVPLIRDALAAIQTWWSENGEAVIAAAIGAYETAKAGIQLAIATIETVVSDALAAIQTWWSENGEAVIAAAIGAYETAKAGIQLAITNVQMIVQTVLEGIQAWWSAHGDSVITVATFIYNTVQSRIETATTTIQAVVAAVLTAIQQFWSDHGAAITEAAEMAWAAIETAVATVTAAIGVIIDAFASAIEGGWYQFGASLRTAWETLWTGIETHLAQVGEAILTIVQSLVTGIVTWFTETDWTALGQSVSDGIMAGVSSLAQRLMAALIDAAGAAKSAWDGFWGNSSPSRLMIASVRDDLGGGVVRGLELMSRNVAARVPAAADMMFQPIVGQMKPRFEALAAGGGSSRMPATFGHGLVQNERAQNNVTVDLRHAVIYGVEKLEQVIEAAVQKALLQNGYRADIAIRAR